MELEIYQVDAFSSTAFAGNPAGVVLDAGELTEKDMQNIANEMNLSETAFVSMVDENNYDLRFFTPINEVDLCGHATIASFYTLAVEKKIPPIMEGVKRVFQNTKAGKLLVEIHYQDWEVAKVMMELSKPQALGVVKDINPLLECFNIREKDIGIEGLFVKPEIISTGLPDIMLPLKDKKALDNLKIDYKALADYCGEMNVIGVHAFYLPFVDSDRVFVRNFAPLVGIDEESATGTANGALTYFLKKEGYIRSNGIMSIQGEFLKRPSRIYCEIKVVNRIHSIKVGGQAIVVMKGYMYL